MADVTFAQQPNIVMPPGVGPVPAALDQAAAEALGTAVPAGPPDPYANRQAILEFYKEFRDECFDQRWLYERVWWKLLLYFLGRQWITYVSTAGGWVDKRLAKWVPRPVTNKIAETVETIHSVFQSVPLDVDVQPDGQEPVDIMTAETANRLAPCLAQEHAMPRQIRISDLWLIILGNVFWHTWWDSTGDKGVVLIPLEQCQACGVVSNPAAIEDAGNVCPKCASPMMQPAIGPDGQPQTEEGTIGSGKTDILSPFEVGFPAGHATFDELPGLIRRRWRTKRYYKRVLSEAQFNKLSFGKDVEDRGIRLLRGLNLHADVNSTPVTFQGAEQPKSEGLVEYELWLKPCKEYPRGLLARFAGDGETVELLEQPEEGIPGPLPFENRKGEPLWPWLHTGYNEVPGRILHKSPLEPLIQIQDQINQIDSLIQLIIQRMANPIWLEPRGSEVKKFTGEPGMVVRYNPLVAGGNAKPEKIEGSNIPPSLLQIRMQKVNDIEQSAGTFDVMKGSKPPNVQAFSALQLLVERSQSRFGVPLKARGTTYAAWFQLALELERQFGPEDRTYAVLGPNKTWTYQQFMNANLQGAVRVVVEDGSQTPKTSLGKRAAIEQLRQMGVVNFMNPDAQYRVLQIFGQTDLAPALNVHVTTALQEQDAFEKWANTVTIGYEAGMVDPATMQPMPPPGPAGAPEAAPGGGAPPGPAGGGMMGDAGMMRPGGPGDGAMMPMGVPGMVPTLSAQPPGQRKIWHDDAVHAGEHIKWANSDKVRQLIAEKPFVEPYVAWMIEVHLQAIAFAEMQQAQAGADNRHGPGGGGRAMERSNNESGNPGDEPRGQGTDQQGQGPQ
jgi:hypothetical protein